MAACPRRTKMRWSGGVSVLNGAAATVTLANLTAGHQYAVQVRVDDSRGRRMAARKR